MEPITHEMVHAGPQQQLASLYEERARLLEAIGTADADEIIAMIRSLESQLQALYEERMQEFSSRPNDM